MGNETEKEPVPTGPEKPELDRGRRKTTLLLVIVIVLAAILPVSEAVKAVGSHIEAKKTVIAVQGDKNRTFVFPDGSALVQSRAGTSYTYTAAGSETGKRLSSAQVGAVKGPQGEVVGFTIYQKGVIPNLDQSSKWQAFFVNDRDMAEYLRQLNAW